MVSEVTAAAVLGFLQRTVRPTYHRAGWRLQRVLTDGWKEFKGAFGVGCARLRIRHTRTKPRHAWTNGFVERLQSTILHEHWRVGFRRQYFTASARCSSHSSGFTPASVFLGAGRRVSEHASLIRRGRRAQ